jgi:predicted dinucleotide-binding enzyme
MRFEMIPRSRVVAGMLGYNYRFLASNGDVVANFMLYSSSDESARELAEELLEKSHWAAVEVWRSGTLIWKATKADQKAA